MTTYRLCFKLLINYKMGVLYKLCLNLMQPATVSKLVVQTTYHLCLKLIKTDKLCSKLIVSCFWY